MKDYLTVSIVFLLILSEICLYFSPITGFVLYSIIIALGLISLSQQDALNDYGKLIIVLLIIPIIRMTSVFINLDFIWEVIISYSILLFLSFYYSMRFKLDHGHKKEKLGLIPLVILIGLALGFEGNLFLDTSKYMFMMYLIPFIAYSEEILFRGMIQKLFNKNYPSSVSILITALLYGAFSIGFGFLFAAFMFLAGIVIGITYNQTKNIFLCVIINLILHYFLFVF